MHLRTLLALSTLYVMARTLSDSGPCICDDAMRSAVCPHEVPLNQTGCRLARHVFVPSRPLFGSVVSLVKAAAGSLQGNVSASAHVTLVGSISPTAGTFSLNGSGTPTLLSGSFTLLTSTQMALIVAGGVLGSLLLLTTTLLGLFFRWRQQKKRATGGHGSDGKRAKRKRRGDRSAAFSFSDDEDPPAPPAGGKEAIAEPAAQKVKPTLSPADAAEFGRNMRRWGLEDEASEASAPVTSGRKGFRQSKRGPPTKDVIVDLEPEPDAPSASQAPAPPSAPPPPPPTPTSYANPAFDWTFSDDEAEETLL